MDQPFDFALHARKGLFELLALGGEHLLPESLFQTPTRASRDASQCPEIVEPTL